MGRIGLGRPALLAGLLWTWQPGILAAQPAAPVARAADPALQAKARKLAEAVQPRERVVDQAMAALEQGFGPAMLANPDIEALDKAHPGYIQALWRAAAPVLRRQLDAALPDLWTRLTSVYAEQLDAGEIDEITRFFQTAVGRKFLDGINNRIDAKSVLEATIRSSDGGLDAEAYRTSVRDAGSRTYAAMTPDERQAFARFILSPAGKAFQKAAPAAERTGMEWMNRKDPAADAEMETAIKRAATDFLAAEKSRPQGK